MSTRLALKNGTSHGATSHVCDDPTNELAGLATPSMCLCIGGVEAELRALPDGGASVSLVLTVEVSGSPELLASSQRQSMEVSRAPNPLLEIRKRSSTAMRRKALRPPSPWK